MNVAKMCHGSRNCDKYVTQIVEHCRT